MNNWRKLSLISLTLPAPLLAAELPVPCVAGACGPSVTSFVSSGQAGAVSSGNLLRVDQFTDRAIMNWASFDVGSGRRVEFHQPNATSIALNRIYQADPSRILGTIDANGQIYLVNPNGIVFGKGARVNTAGLIASTLDISDANFTAGLLAPELLQNNRPALASDGRASVLDAEGNPVLGPDGEPLEIRLVVEEGAKLTTTGAGSRLLLASRTVENAGELSAPDGQVVLAAGEKVYLASSSDAALRGLLVEVDTGGKVWNQLTGKVAADRGNVSLVGLAVNQDGRISATTSVSANGSIRLLARDTANISLSTAGTNLLASRGGTLTVGEGSTTTVTPELADTATAVDDQTQLPSSIELSGRQILVQPDAHVTAAGGVITAAARVNPTGGGSFDPEARLRIHERAELSVAGTQAEAPVTRNIVQVELRANELRDSPLQRDGALRGKTVYVDTRVGTPLADVSGAARTVARTVAERTSVGGSVDLSSDGDIVVATGATIDVSGGAIQYTPGLIQTTQLITESGKVVDIGAADPNVLYAGLVNPTQKRSYQRWGVTETLDGPAIGRYDPGYTEGRDGGALRITADRLVLNGEFRGATTAGELQRDAAHLPRAALLQIGTLDTSGAFPDYHAPSIDFVLKAPTLAISDSAALPGPVTLELPIEFLATGGFRNVELNSNGIITLDLDDPLMLLPGSMLKLTATQVNVRSDIVAPSGTIGLSAVLTRGIDGLTPPDPGITLVSGVTVDVSGRWINDAITLNGGGSLQDLAPLFYKGGSIALAIRTNEATFDIGDGVALLADGGGWLSSSGRITGGAGGSIRLAASYPDVTLGLGSDVKLSAYGVAAASGGSFAFEAPRIEVVDDSRWARPVALPTGVVAEEPPASEETPAAPALAHLEVGTGLFTEHGFASVSLAATGPVTTDENVAALTIDASSQIRLHPATLQPGDAANNARTGTPIEAFTTRLQPLVWQEKAASLRFEVKPTDFNDGNKIGRLAFEAGATIDVTPGSSVQFVSPGGLDLAGGISAPGGTLSASIPNPSAAFDIGYRALPVLNVASTALWDVSGIAILRPNDAGLRLGTLLAGGSINLVADRGAVNVLAGSQLRADGFGAILDLPSDPGGATAGYLATPLASAAGSMTIRAPEALQVFGNLSARAGTGGELAVAGGNLTVQLSRERGFSSGALGATYPVTERVLQITGTPVVGSGALPSGLGFVDAQLFARGGFDNVTLEAGDRIEFQSVSHLSLARSLTLDAPQIGVPGAGHVTVSAPYLALGRSLPPLGAVAAVTGEGTFAARADLLDLVGVLGITGVSEARFVSTGDIRLRGVDLNGVAAGSLEVPGTIGFSGQRLYPATATAFTIRASGDTPGTVNIAQNGTSPGTPLSAGGNLTIVAGDINQGGSLYAPFGRIALQGSRAVTLAAGSLTSVSVTGAVVPFGRTSVGDWLYDLPTTLKTINALPARRIDLSAPVVQAMPDSVIDLAGGGDLQAYEWTPGSGGSSDALLSSRSGRYAILPWLRGQGAPYDFQEFNGSTLKPGDSLYVGASALLNEGTYALLPARYALLPGAVLVDVATGYTNLAQGASYALNDGTPVVAGRRVSLGTGIGDATYSGFALHRGEYAHALATYDTTRASEFFPARAARLELGRVGIPADAGALGIDVGARLAMSGKLLTAGATGGINAAIDLSAPALQVLRSADDATAGAVGVAAATLSGWNSSSLLLGGLRDATDTDTVTLGATSVTVGDGASIVADEVLVAARERIELRSGSSVASRAGASRLEDDAEPELLQLTGTGADAGALLGVSDLRRIDVAAGTAASGGATISIAPGAQLRSSSALLAAAPGGGELLGTLQGAGAYWSLAANRIAVSEAAVPDALTLTSANIGAVGAGLDATLASRTSIDFLSSARIGGNPAAGAALRDITLNAAALRSLAPGVQVDVTAGRELTLGGAAGTPATAAPGTGALHLAARQLTIAAGSQQVTGFDSVGLTATAALRGEGIGQLGVSAPLDVATPEFRAGTGATTTLASTGALRVHLPAATASSADPAGLGGAWTLEGARIDVDGTKLTAPAGQINLHATGDLALRGATLDAGGAAVSINGRNLTADAGSIGLDAGGAVSVDAGSRLGVAAPATARAGLITVRAGGVADLAGALSGTGAEGFGSAFAVKAGSLTDFGALNETLESGGFSRARDIEVAAGDLVLAEGNTVHAGAVRLAADDGMVRVAGTILARSADERASVSLYGARGVELAPTAVVEAAGTGESGRGGTVTLGTSEGPVNLAARARISTPGAAEDGRVLVRAPVQGNDAAITALAANFTDVAEVQLEPYQQFSVGDSLTASDWDTYRQALELFQSTVAPALLSRLAVPADVNLRLRPGLQLDRQGDLSVAAMDFSTWRFGDQPANITVRATGSISLTGTVSDGLTPGGTTSRPRAGLPLAASGALRFAAGSALTGADPVALGGGNTADFRLGTNAILRSATGDLSVTAARDIVFGTRSSVYTAGLQGAPTDDRDNGPSFAFPVHGGQVLLAAGRDVVGSPTTQAVGDWQPRAGRPATDTTDAIPTAWGVDVGRFGWNVGALGGGDLRITAGRDVVSLSAAVANSGLQQADGTVATYGGGVLDIAAGRDVSSLFAHATRGLSELTAGRAFARSRPVANEEGLGTLLSLQEGSFDVRARTGIALESAFNPTLVLQPSVSTDLRSIFYTYGKESSLDAVTAAGDLSLSYKSQRLAGYVGNTSNAVSLAYLPPDVRLQALSGDVRLGGALSLMASDRGQLDVAAARDIDARAANGNLAMADAAAATIPTPETPLSDGVATVLNVIKRTAAGARHEGDLVPVAVTAGRDILGVNFTVPKAITVSAGRDIRDTTIIGQNVNAADVSSVAAGRDIAYSAAATSRRIEVAGPGSAVVVAGRDVDLGFSAGITTIGALKNPELPSSIGADLAVIAGAAAGIDVTALVAKVVAPSADHRKRLVEFMQEYLGAKNLGYDQAATAFLALDRAAQWPLVSQVFFTELVRSGREVNADPTVGFDRGYAAIDALFPGSRGTDGEGEGSPYAGDLLLAFSRIYTLSGGNISLFTPGGMLNVGLANPPANLPVQRTPSDLGIVAQKAGDVRVFTTRDVLVNQSRIFTLGGGDIAVWSTLGDIDAGRGAKSAISAPPPRVSIDSQGNVVVDLGAAVAGSGIRTIVTGEDIRAGDVDLIAPRGIINAGDAGIGSAGNLNVAAQQVAGLDNIQVGGNSAGVPAETSNLGASLSGASASSSSANSAASSSLGERGTEEQTVAPLAQSALGWLDVFVEGFGEEVCKPTDDECLRRNRKP